MKLRISFVSALLLGSLVFALSGTALAQHLISSKAGFVNRADGTVYVLRRDSEDGQPGRASLGTQLRDGDRLSTDADSRAEILLNPGSYLRLDEKSEVRAISTSLSEPRFELLKGSMIVEVGQLEKKTAIELLTPNGTLSIAKDALIRVDAKTAATWVAVRQGEVYLGTREVALADQGQAKIKRGKLVRLTGGNAQADIAKIDRDAAADNFDTWSFSRAQTLVAANLSSLRRNSLLSGGWYYDPFFTCYTFVPYRGYLMSPYGFGFFRNWADCYWYNPFNGYYGNPYYYPGNRGGNGGGTVVTNLPPRVVTGVDREPVRREMPASRGISSDSFGRADVGGRSVGGFSSPSVSAPSSSSSTTISAPAPSRSEGSSAGTMPSRGNNR